MEKQAACLRSILRPKLMLYPEPFWIYKRVATPTPILEKSRKNAIKYK